jgi:hypothetical protein
MVWNLKHSRPFLLSHLGGWKKGSGGLAVKSSEPAAVAAPLGGGLGVVVFVVVDVLDTELRYRVPHSTTFPWSCWAICFLDVNGGRLWEADEVKSAAKRARIADEPQLSRQRGGGAVGVDGEAGSAGKASGERQS